MTAAHGPVTDLVAAAAQKQSSPFGSILIFVAIGAAFYFLIYRPQQRKQQAARAQTNAFEVGDEVVTAGGIVGRVLDVTDDRVTLETSVGASFVVLRPYVLRKLEPVVPPTDVVDGPVPPAEPGPESDTEGTSSGEGTAGEAPGGSADGEDEAHDEAAPTTPPPDADEDTEPEGPETPPKV
jgi:preprotein translocase subunit YajC